MKLSSLNTDRAADVLCELAPFAENIVTDTGLSEALKGVLEKGATVAELYRLGAQKIARITPILLKTHRNDVFNVLAILNESTVEDIAGQNVMVTLGQIKDIFQDKDLMNFFKSFQQEGAKE